MTNSIAERQIALEARYPSWKMRALHEMLDDAESAFSKRPFVITDARSWTYGEMVDWSRRLADGLWALGVRPGDKIAVIMANYPEFIALKFAISRVGAVAVPINVLNRRDELNYLLWQSDAAVLVTMDRFRDVDYLQTLDEIAPGWERNGGGEILPKLRKIVVFPTESDARLRANAVLFSSLEPAESQARTAISVDPQADCDIIYTSGTTGSPKGVLVTHDMLIRTAYASAYSRAFEDGHRILFSLPMYHVFGYVEGLLSVLFVGGAVIPQLRFDAADTLAGISRHRATDALLIPMMTMAAINEMRARPYDLSSLHSVLASGGRAPERIWQEIHDVLGVREITTGYGMTETTASTTITRPDDPIERLLTTNGRQRDAGAAGKLELGGKLVVYQAVDPESGAIRRPGELGELVAKGPGVTRGYYNKPEATAAAFTKDGWLKTGDLGLIDQEGYITLVGRSKESYRCGGEQVLPSEIEDVLVSDPDVLQAHIVPVPDERMGEVGVAFIVARPGSRVSAEGLHRLTSERLARFKVPRHFLFVSEADIPTTASGRARKFMLSQQAIRKLGLA